jgi:hypothetical protein
MKQIQSTMPKTCSVTEATMPKCDNADWAQCGGKEFTGATCCPAGSACAYTNEWWSQCAPGFAQDN